jgi:hypothetical protein
LSASRGSTRRQVVRKDRAKRSALSLVAAQSTFQFEGDFPVGRCAYARRSSAARLPCMPQSQSRSRRGADRTAASRLPGAARPATTRWLLWHG